MKVRVQVFSSDKDGEKVVDYIMDHDNAEQRKVLGQQCRHAFEAGQKVVTFAINPPR